jgi:hypothetical protein
MYQLSDEQIDYIFNDISARGVEMESLQQNLVDHVCCIIERDLEENGDFGSFYEKTIKTFYKDALWEIEEETLQLLIFKNYYTMKKIMIISGMGSVLGFIAGSIFKVMHWPGASFLILCSIVTMAFAFLPILFVLKVKEKSTTRDKMTLGIGTVLGILFCLSVLFKIMHWPGANTLNFLVILLLLFVFIPLYFFTGIRNPDTKTNTIVTTILLIGVGGMLFAMTSIRSSKQIHLAKMYNYLQNEELISRMQCIKADSSFQHSESAKLSADIQRLAIKIKGMVIYEQIGQSTIPADFEAQNIWLEEAALNGEFRNGGASEVMVIDLKNKINRYNLLIARQNNKNRIPNTIEKIMDNNLLQQSNYNLLSSISQIQLMLLENEKELVAKK